MNFAKPVFSVKLFYFILCLFPIALSAQSRRFVLAGNLPQFLNQNLQLQYYSSPFESDQKAGEIILDENGKFSVQIFFQEPQPIYLIAGPVYIRFWGKPGDSLYVKSPKNDYSKVIFYGKGAPEANYMLAQRSYFSTSIEAPEFSLNLLNEMSYRSPEGFKNYCDSIRIERVKFLEQHSAGLPARFIQTQKAELIYEMETYKLNYPSWYYSMRGIYDKVLPVDSGYYSYLKTLSINEPSYLGSSQYRNYLKYYIIHQISKLERHLSSKEIYDISSRYYSGEVLKVFHLHLWSDIVYRGAVTDAKNLYPLVKAECSSIPGFNEIEAAYKDKLPFTKGAKAYPFILKDATGKIRSLEEFKGKLVFIDFWASWCRPCLGEIPAGETLKKYFEGKDIVFLNISIDENETNWREAMMQYTISGIHLLANSSNPEVLSAYKIESIPSYFLIDKEGNFISAPAPRPSSADLIPLIEQALNGK